MKKLALKECHAGDGACVEVTGAANAVARALRPAMLLRCLLLLLLDGLRQEAAENLRAKTGVHGLALHRGGRWRRIRCLEGLVFQTKQA